MAAIAVFLGPTLTIEEARRELDATYYPPAAQGDVYRAALARPVAIGIIDGYFDSVPAVWHKEILWAMTQGIAVYGAASMGALRAAELSSFGMRGVGEIFEAFSSGALEQDDEVAVSHAGPEAGFRRMSEAMVNLRATLRAAEAAGIIAARLGVELERLGRSLHYVDRTWPALLTAARTRAIGSQDALDSLTAFVAIEAVDQKRLDALAMLRIMKAECTADSPPPVVVHYRFQHTVAWELMRRGARAIELVPREPSTESGPRFADELLEELRLQGRNAERRGALLRALAIEATRSVDGQPSPTAVADAAEAFRRERDLLSASALEQWASTQRVPDLRRFFEDEALVRATESTYAAEADAMLPDHLRATGQFGQLMARVEAKRTALRQRGLELGELADTGLSASELWRWYFEERLQCPVPLQLEQWARAAGFSDLAELQRAVVRERLFLSQG